MAELVREIVIAASPETIWPFLVEPDKHVEWLGTVAEIDPRPGGTFRVLVGGRNQSSGEYVEVVPNEKVAFTFGWEQEGNPITPGSSTVEITLHPEGDKTASVSSTATSPPTPCPTTPAAGITTSRDSTSSRPAAMPGPTSHRRSPEPHRPRGHRATDEGAPTLAAPLTGSPTVEHAASSSWPRARGNGRARRPEGAPDPWASTLAGTASWHWRASAARGRPVRLRRPVVNSSYPCPDAADRGLDAVRPRTRRGRRLEKRSTTWHLEGTSSTDVAQAGVGHGEGFDASADACEPGPAPRRGRGFGERNVVTTTPRSRSGKAGSPVPLTVWSWLAFRPGPRRRRRTVNWVDASASTGRMGVLVNRSMRRPSKFLASRRTWSTTTHLQLPRPAPRRRPAIRGVPGGGHALLSEW